VNTAQELRELPPEEAAPVTGIDFRVPIVTAAEVTHPRTIRRRIIGADNAVSDLVVRFTGREVQMVQGLAKGLIPRQIARELAIGVGTVRSYLTQATKKLGASGSAATVEAAYVARLLPPPGRKAGDIELSETQRQLVPLISQGMSRVQMAEQVDKPLQDVREDVRALMQALRAKTLAHVVTRARQHGLPTSEEEARTVALIDTVLGWDVNNGDLPGPDYSLKLIGRFREYGRTLELDLQAVASELPYDPDVHRSALATLGEASRRLDEPDPDRQKQPAARRAQNLARLLQGLRRALAKSATTPADEDTCR
jgi:DNA-binding NarL/FixJ family response regulator